MLQCGAREESHGPLETISRLSRNVSQPAFTETGEKLQRNQRQHEKTFQECQTALTSESKHSIYDNMIGSFDIKIKTYDE